MTVEKALIVEITKMRGDYLRSETKCDVLNAELNRLREPVRWFAEQMERKLAMHDDRSGWTGDYLDALLERIDDERKELGMVLQCGISNSSQPHKQKIIDECADIANFCMMIADNLRAYIDPPR